MGAPASVRTRCPWANSPAANTPPVRYRSKETARTDGRASTRHHPAAQRARLKPETPVPDTPTLGTTAAPPPVRAAGVVAAISAVVAITAYYRPFEHWIKGSIEMPS